VNDAAWFSGAQAGAGRGAESVDVGLGSPIVATNEHNTNVLDFDPVLLAFVIVSSRLYIV